MITLVLKFAIHGVHFKRVISVFVEFVCTIFAGILVKRCLLVNDNHC